MEIKQQAAIGIIIKFENKSSENVSTDVLSVSLNYNIFIDFANYFRDVASDFEQSVS